METGEATPALGQAYVIMGLLISASILSYLDRAIVSLMVDPIRHDLNLSDTQIGAANGLAFALFYALMGIPLGRWADRHNRRNLIVGGVLAWSLATACCGLAQDFHQFLLGRLLVGVGEASLGPASVSIIAAAFRGRNVGLALAVTSVGITLGCGVAIMGGGSIVHWAMSASLTVPALGVLRGWRLAFLLAGAPGLGLAALFGFVKEPPRPANAPPPEIGRVVAHLRAHAGAYGLLMIGYSLLVVMSFGQLIWAPTYFLRVHHMTLASFTPYYGIMMGLGGTGGLLLGGFLSDQLSKRGVAGAPAKVMLASAIVQTPLLIAAYLAVSTSLALVLFALAIFAMCFIGGLQGATFERIAPPRMVATVIALYLVVANVVGGGVGQLAIGALSQHLSPTGSKLGVALAIVGLATLPLSALLIAAALPGLARAEQENRVPPSRNAL